MLVKANDCISLKRRKLVLYAPPGVYIEKTSFSFINKILSYLFNVTMAFEGKIQFPFLRCLPQQLWRWRYWSRCRYYCIQTRDFICVLKHLPVPKVSRGTTTSSVCVKIWPVGRVWYTPWLNGLNWNYQVFEYTEARAFYNWKKNADCRERPVTLATQGNGKKQKMTGKDHIADGIGMELLPTDIFCTILYQFIKTNAAGRERITCNEREYFVTSAFRR